MTDRRLLLERDEPLARLGRAMTAAAGGQGCLVLLGGEAGIGKTSLVRRFAATVEGAPVVTGACDPLSTPPALGPMRDLAPRLGPAFEQLLDGARSGRDLYAAVLAKLAALTTPVVLVFEDMHWADQASLELVGFLGRRAERLRLLIIVTFREEETYPGGPLALTLGDLATTPGLLRLRLGPLSRAATAQLAEGSAADMDELYHRTGGNPFFITEILGARSPEIPPTVRDAVLARVARLTPEARRALQAAAAIGVRTDPGLLAKVMEAAGTPRWGLHETINAGLLEQRGPSVAFRHALAQSAIAEATPPELRQRLHASILVELRHGPVGSDDYAILTGHAEVAGDDGAVLELAPLAAARAAAFGAHREAAQFYSKALERARHQPALVADLRERRGAQYYATRRFAEAMDDHRLAANLCRDLGDHRGEGRNLIQFSYLSLAAGDRVASEAALDAALALLEALPPSRELASAYEARGRRLFVSNEPGPAEVWAERAAALAERLGDAEVSVEAGVTAAVSRLLRGDDAGRARLQALREVAYQRSQTEAWARDTCARATYYLAFIPMLRRRYDEVDRYLDEGRRYALDHELDYWQSMMAGARVQRSLDAGRWRDVVDQAQAVLDMRDPAWRSELLAWSALARVKCRTGQPDARACLDRATELARRDPAIADTIWPARVEAAWLAGDIVRLLREAEQARAESARARDPWWEAELAFWVHLAGGAVDPGALAAGPYRQAILGDWAAAARWWEERGCPYEMAVTLAGGDEPAAVRRAITVLDRLGAIPAAAYARRRLRELGVASVPRGPRPSTSANPAGLSGREQEVLALVATGLSNAQIAARLFLSEKTVERHLGGIFAKLDVASRGEAVQAAARVGALPNVQIEGPSAPN
jgi:DNA-binding CsgD family transcriptional regulator